MRVTLKLATSLDGRIATKTGESQWITCAESRRCVHELRARHHGVLVGIGTALADDPQLTVRGVELGTGVQPHRVILDTHLRLPVSSRVLTCSSGQTFIVHGAEADTGLAGALKDAGARLLECPFGDNGRLDPVAALRLLEGAGLCSLFVEGGGEVAAAFLMAGCVDTLEWFRAPMIIGGDGKPALGPLGVDVLAQALRFKRGGVRIIGDDVWETYEVEAS